MNQWGPNAFLYIHVWGELSANHLTAFDESGEVRGIYATARDQFFAGPGLGVRTAVESCIDFTRVLPFARFLTRHGMSVLAYDKRGVGRLDGRLEYGVIEDLAGDVVAAFEYLKSRRTLTRPRNHTILEAKTGMNAESISLQRFAPEYSAPEERLTAVYAVLICVLRNQATVCRRPRSSATSG